jgi:polar amino acid transport system substrate-binding protein
MKLSAPLLRALAIVGAVSIGAPFTVAKADLLSQIQAKKEIVIATETRYPPFEYIEDGKIVGYGPDLLHEIMRSSLPDVAIKQLDLPWQSILPGLSAKRFDLVVTAVGISPERAKQYAFTFPIADATAALVKRKGDTSIKTPDDLGGKSVGANAGSLQIELLRKMSMEMEKKTGHGMKAVQEYVDFNGGVADLLAGRIDALSHPLPNLAYLVKQQPDKFELIPGTIGPKSYFAWVGRKDEESASLIELFNKALAQLNQSGKMTELQLKWFGVEMKVPASAIVPTE